MNANMVRIDPVLLKQLRAAEESSSSANATEVEAVFMLQKAFDGSGAINRSNIETVVQRLLERAEGDSHQQVSDLQVFKNLGTFVVKAPPGLLRTLMDRKEIRSAKANRHDQE